MAEQRQVAVVTGGASGIGLAIVKHFASQGAAVIAVDRDETSVAAAGKDLASYGDAVKAIAADIGTAEGAEASIAAAMDGFGRIDVLCNNAGVHPLERIEDHDLETWRETFRVNVDGTMLCCRAALTHMKAKGAGSIINMGSISGISPYARGGAYAASKAAVAMFTKVLAIEAGPYGITVNCISPGSIRHGPDRPGEAPPAHIPVGRRGTTDDVVGLVAYLASDAARYLTGADIVLDGGATAGRVGR